MNSANFWHNLEAMVGSCRLVIDRPKGTRHPHYPDFVYPYDYGYLEDTHSSDMAGIDVWRGSLPMPVVTAIICTVDLHKRDSEVKLLLGCTKQEAQDILAVHNSGSQAGLLIERLE